MVAQQDGAVKVVGEALGVPGRFSVLRYIEYKRVKQSLWI